MQRIWMKSSREHQNLKHQFEQAPTGPNAQGQIWDLPDTAILLWAQPSNPQVDLCRTSAELRRSLETACQTFSMQMQKGSPKSKRHHSPAEPIEETPTADNGRNVRRHCFNVASVTNSTGWMLIAEADIERHATMLFPPHHSIMQRMWMKSSREHQNPPAPSRTSTDRTSRTEPHWKSQPRSTIPWQPSTRSSTSVARRTRKLCLVTGISRRWNPVAPYLFGEIIDLLATLRKTFEISSTNWSYEQPRT